MRFSLLFLLLSLLFSHGLATTPSNLATALFSEDLFLNHLRSDFLNHSTNPCDNFYRHVCPKDFVKSDELFEKLKAQVEAIEKIRAFLSPPHADHTLKRLWTAWDAEVAQRPLDDTAFVRAQLSGASARSILALFRTLTVVHKHKGLEQIAGALIGNEMAAGDYKHVTERYVEANRETAIASLTLLIAQVAPKLDAARKFIDDFTTKLSDEIGVLELLRESDLDARGAMRRVETVIESLLQVYEDRYTTASWGVRENRFGYATAHILRAFLRQIQFAVFFANRYSITAGFQREIAEKFHAEFLAEHRAMSDIGGLHRLRLLHVGLTALAESLRSRSDITRFRLLGPLRVPEISAIPMDAEEYSVIANQLLATHTALTAPMPTLFGFIGVILAHELYHHHQFAHYAFIEDDSEFTAAALCVQQANARVCARMVEKTCSAGEETLDENTADAYGVQIAYEAYMRSGGEDKQSPAYPSLLPITNHELFFYALAVANCRVYKKTQWPTEVRGDMVSKGDHNGEAYRVAAMLAQLPAFKRVFACYDDDRMVYEESARCPVLSERLT